MSTIIKHGIDDSSPSFIRDLDKCIGCTQCVKVCRDVQKIDVYEMFVREDGKKYANTKNEGPVAETNCINCGQCVKVCPVDALRDRNQVEQAEYALANSQKTVLWEVAPSVKNFLGEEFSLQPGDDVTGKIAAALHKLGGLAMDTDFAADVTIMEEATEFLSRMKENSHLPMFTSCCPAWVLHAEMEYPEQLEHLSSTKSPIEIMGSLMKSYYAEKSGLPLESLYHISVVPCTAKKYEAKRPEMTTNGVISIDLVLTAREFATLLKKRNIDLAALQDEKFDPLLSEGSGGGRIFGRSGGVMESALRTASVLATGKKLGKVTFEPVNENDGITAAKLDFDGKEISIAVVNGIGNVQAVMEDVKNGTSPYDFIEVMSCKGGCCAGGGSLGRANRQNIPARISGIDKIDEQRELSNALDNREMMQMYDEYLGKANEGKAHDLLHTHYTKKKSAGSLN
ncbi:hypothetical protein FACS189418_5430 [Clostridia bacterium]|nr:hypothetical protein FACS189418_5430 [Clostridia bacterium]